MTWLRWYFLVGAGFLAFHQWFCSRHFEDYLPDTFPFGLIVWLLWPVRAMWFFGSFLYGFIKRLIT